MGGVTVTKPTANVFGAATAEIKEIKEIILMITQALVDNPEQVHIDEVSGNKASVFEVTAAKSDIGKIVGRNGANLNAMWTILTAVGTKLGRKAGLVVID